jgi:membrane-bound lytic murein transglycosylase B
MRPRCSCHPSRSWRARSAVAFLSALAALAPVSPAVATGDGPPTTGTTTPPAPAASSTTSTTVYASATDPASIGDERVTPEILGVAVRSPDYDEAMYTYTAVATQLDQTRATYEQARRSLIELDAQQIRLTRAHAAAATRRAAAQDRIDRLRSAINEIAVTSYISGGTGGGITDDLRWEDATDHEKRRAITDSILERRMGELQAARAEHDRAQRDEERSGVLLNSVTDRRSETRFVRDSSQAAAFVLSGELLEQGKTVADARLTASVQETDFQFVALDAYVKAAAVLNTDAPTCHMRWQVLAGISRTEGHHGNYRESELGADGTVDPPIIGIPLNGGGSTALVTDTDGGQWDGDPAYDHAVGPMQFIPSTWRYYGVDADESGDINPQNLYDATEAAGRLLCRNSSAYDTPEGLERGLMSYNNSTEYVRVVSGYVRGYDELHLF